MRVPRSRSSFQGKETKRETLLKQVKDVDELMNEELRPCFYPSWLLVHFDRFSTEVVSFAFFVRSLEGATECTQIC